MPPPEASSGPVVSASALPPCVSRDEGSDSVPPPSLGAAPADGTSGSRGAGAGGSGSGREDSAEGVASPDDVADGDKCAASGAGREGSTGAGGSAVGKSGAGASGVMGGVEREGARAGDSRGRSGVGSAVTRRPLWRRCAAPPTSACARAPGGLARSARGSATVRSTNSGGSRSLRGSTASTAVTRTTCRASEAARPGRGGRLTEGARLSTGPGVQPGS
jgi:hypothetical protein